MKPTFGSAYLDDNLTQFTTIHCILFTLSSEAMISTEITISKELSLYDNIRASKNISGLVKIMGPASRTQIGACTFYL